MSRGFWQASRIAVYMLIVAQVMTNGQRWFGRLTQVTGPMLALLLFGFSALVCALLVFAKPYELFMNKKGKEALALVVSTTKWLGFYLLLLMGYLFVK